MNTLQSVFPLGNHLLLEAQLNPSLTSFVFFLQKHKLTQKHNTFSNTVSNATFLAYASAKGQSLTFLNAVDLQGHRGDSSTLNWPERGRTSESGGQPRI